MPHYDGARGAAHTGLKFTDMKLDKKYLLGEEGQAWRSPSTPCPSPRAHIAASNLGMCQRMLEMSLARANDRITFGKPIASPPDDQARDRRDADVHPRPALHGLRLRPRVRRRPQRQVHRGEGRHVQASPIYSTRIVSDGMLEIFGGDGYSRTPLRPDRSACTATPAPCGSRRGAPNVQRITIARNCQKFGGKVEYQL